MESWASVGTFERVTLPPGGAAGGASGRAFMSYFAAGPRQGPAGPPGWWHFSPLLSFLSVRSDHFWFPRLLLVSMTANVKHQH